MFEHFLLFWGGGSKMAKNGHFLRAKSTDIIYLYIYNIHQYQYKPSHALLGFEILGQLWPWDRNYFFFILKVYDIPDPRESWSFLAFFFLIMTYYLNCSLYAFLNLHILTITFWGLTIDLHKRARKRMLNHYWNSQKEKNR